MAARRLQRTASGGSGRALRVVLVGVLLACTILHARTCRADLVQQLVSGVSEERIRSDIAALEFTRAAPGDLAAAAALISQRFSEAGYVPEHQPVSYSENVIARLPGLTQPGQIFVIGAHFDTVYGTPGADDNASGVAAVLEIARSLSGIRLPFTVEFVAFTLEETYPYFLGSRSYRQSRMVGGQQIIGMICFEMIGYTCANPGCQTPFYNIPGCLQVEREGVDTGLYIAPLVNDASTGLLEACNAAAAAYVPDLERLSMQVAANGGCYGFTRRSDHVPFWDVGIPAISFFDTIDMRTPWYHTSGDRLETLDLPFCRRVTQLGLAMVLQSGVSDVPPIRIAPLPVLAVYPNPSSGEVRIRFDLRGSGAARLGIYDAGGRSVRALDAGVGAQGPHELVLDGLDGKGRGLPAGAYFVRLETNSDTVRRKLIIAR